MPADIAASATSISIETQSFSMLKRGPDDVNIHDFTDPNFTVVSMPDVLDFCHATVADQINWHRFAPTFPSSNIFARTNPLLSIRRAAGRTSDGHNELEAGPEIATAT